MGAKTYPTHLDAGPCIVCSYWDNYTRFRWKCVTFQLYDSTHRRQQHHELTFIWIQCGQRHYFLRYIDYLAPNCLWFHYCPRMNSSENKAFCLKAKSPTADYPYLKAIWSLIESSFKNMLWQDESIPKNISQFENEITDWEPAAQCISFGKKYNVLDDSWMFRTEIVRANLNCMSSNCIKVDLCASHGPVWGSWIYRNSQEWGKLQM